VSALNSGQSVHFRNFAPDRIEYAINRYAFEAQRHFGILDARLAKQKYMLGDTYTIVDMDKATRPSSRPRLIAGRISPADVALSGSYTCAARASSGG
jgi:glutathione S-transferase